MRRLVSLPWATFFGSLFVILTTIGLIGNTIVIIAISGDRKMRKSVMNMLLLNLAVADALNLFTTMAEWTSPIIVGRPEWILPDFLCPVARYFECVFLFASILTQLIVCVERYIAIVYPIHARRLCSRNNILFIVGLTWLFVCTFALPYALLNEKSAKSGTCHNFFMGTTFWMNYKWAELFIFYLGPFFMFIVLYSKVSCVLWAKNRQLYEGVSNTASEVTQRSEALATRRNVVKMLVACVCVYFICYSPIQGIFLSKVLFNVSVHPPYEFILLMNALAMTCSACNPLLYTLFSKRFRARMAKLILCRAEGASANPRKEMTNSFTKVSTYYTYMSVN